MRNRKFLSLLLCLALAVSVIVPGMTANAVDGDTGKGVVIHKTATDNKDGTYTIQLEAYATGSKVITETSKDVPTDIVLVLDQSGSMSSHMKSVTYSVYSNRKNSNLYNKRHNGGSGNLWYKLDNNTYASVSVEYEVTGTGYAQYSNQTNSTYNTNKDSLFVKVGENYHKLNVEVSTSGDWWNPTYTYTYTDGNGDGHTYSRQGNNQRPNFDGFGIDGVYRQEEVREYTYTCNDAEGNEIQIGKSSGADNDFTTDLFQRVEGNNGPTRLQALKDAASQFADSVAAKAAGANGIPGDDDDVKHRIAVVGFSSSAEYKTGSNASSALQDMTTTNGVNSVNTAIDNLYANGSTYINQGIAYANNIFNANPITDDSGRNRIVIVFTDGVPGYSSSWYNDSESTGNGAISNAYTAKHTYNAAVYGIGIFDGADVGNPAELPSYQNSQSNQTNNANRMMHLVSSNYLDATSFTSTGSVNPSLNGKSFYLSAADAGSLSSIFQQISDQIETGKSDTTLDEKAVIQDIIAPAFRLPDNATAANISLKTYKYVGGDQKLESSWQDNNDAMGATATVGSDNQVSVSGFDFAGNYVGSTQDNQTHFGNKLVISFDVVVREGFLGGNKVFTNAEAHIYENADKVESKEPLFTFDRPIVDVPTDIVVAVTAPDKNVYLYDSVDAGVTATVQDASEKDIKVNLDFSKDNFGLEAWQNEYVTIQIKEENGYQKTFTDLTEDKSYTAKVVVTPKNSGEAKEHTGSDGAKINVFKPTMTFQDGFVNPNTTITNTGYMGKDANGADAAKSYKDDNYVSTVWKHGDVKDTDTSVTMATQTPKIDLAYTPAATTASSGDVNVAVAAKIGNNPINDYTTFVHNPCDDDVKCDWMTPDPNKGNPAFQLHVNTSTMTIKKMVTGNMGDQSKTFKFKVTIDGVEQPGEINLTHDHTCAPIEVKVGSVVQITETNKGKYTMSGTGGGGQMKENSKDTYTFTVQADPAKNQIVITNEFEADVDTGFVDDVLPFVIIFMLVAACGAGLLLYHETRYRGIY